MHRRCIDWSIVGVGRARKGNTPYLLLLLLGLMSISVGAYFEEAIAFFNTPNYVLMDDVEFFLTMAACLASMALFLIVAIKKGNLKPNYLFIGLFGLLIISNAVGLLAFPSSIEGFTHHLDGTKTAFSYSIDVMDRVRFMILFVVGMGYLYVLFCVLPQLLKDGRSLMFLFYAAAFVSFFAIAWSIGMEWPIYVKYFSIKTEVTASVYASSFFYNRNLFGMMLVIGICSLIFIHNHHPHWWNFLLIGILFCELFFVISKTSILIAMFAVFAFLLYRFLLTIRLHWRRNLIVLFFFLAAPLAVFLLGFYKTLGENFVFSKMVDNLLLAFEGTHAGSVKSRFDIWYASIMMLSDSPHKMDIRRGGEQLRVPIGEDVRYRQTERRRDLLRPQRLRPYPLQRGRRPPRRVSLPARLFPLCRLYCLPKAFQIRLPVPRLLRRLPDPRHDREHRVPNDRHQGLHDRLDGLCAAAIRLQPLRPKAPARQAGGL